jgi:prepilin peptidase CpaA
LNALDIAIVLIGSLSAFFDITMRRIPNWLILIGVASGLTIAAFHGGQVFLQSFLGLIIGIAILVLPFAMGWIGAGDVKFFGVTGALLGVLLLPRIFFYSAFVAGFIALGSFLTGRIRFFSFKEFWFDVKIAIVSGGNVVPESVRCRVAHRDESIPWGVAFAVGSLIAYYVDPKGEWAGF